MAKMLVCKRPGLFQQVHWIPFTSPPKDDEVSCLVLTLKVPYPDVDHTTKLDFRCT